MFDVIVDRTVGALDPAQGAWPPQHLARGIAELVDEHLDFGPLRVADTGMVSILLYGYTTGVRSSRVIARKCRDDVAFRWLAAGATPGHRAIADFRRQHRTALRDLFVQALVSCHDAGMVRLGRVELAGTGVRFRSSEPRATSAVPVSEWECVLAEKVSALLADADRVDGIEDLVRREPRRRQATARRTAPRALLGTLLVALTFGTW